MFIIILLLNYIIATVYTEYDEKAFCPQIHDCNWIYPYYLTENLKCTHNDQCPFDFLCCSDCHYQHKVCKTAVWVAQNKIKIECPKSTIYCKKKFPYLGTQMYKCDLDNDCDYSSLCCYDDCYTHKICKKAVRIEDNEDDCSESFNICTYPLLPYEETKQYKCVSSKQCQDNYVCCPDSCYTHNICKSKTQEQNELCPISVRKEYCTNINKTLTKYSCKNDNDCHAGYLCCLDNCYVHKVCKLSTEAFSYKSVYVQKTVTILNFEEQHKCPKLEEKCTKPYSLRLAKKFICFKDDDCKIGQLCCKDTCVKDFKICKDIFNIYYPNSTTKEFPISNTENKQLISEIDKQDSTENTEIQIQNKEFYFDETDQSELVQSKNEEGSGSGYTINDGEDD